MSLIIPFASVFRFAIINILFRYNLFSTSVNYPRVRKSSIKVIAHH